MIGYAFATALLAAVTSASAWKGSGAKLLDSTSFDTFVETEIYMQINSEGKWLNIINDATWKFTNSTATTLEKTDIVNCLQGTDGVTCLHFMSTSHLGEDAFLSLYVNSMGFDAYYSYNF
mgnify:CR=1 FL=1|jgi:hypothetical protein